MRPKEHLLYGAAASAVLSPAFGTDAAFFFAGSVLIDTDHYLDYLYFARFRNWSVKAMFRFHGQLSQWVHDPKLLALEAFHTVEFLLGVLLVGLLFRSPSVLSLAAGMTFHLGLDLWRLAEHRVIPVRALSFVEYWLRARRMRRSGIDPERIFFDAYALAERSRHDASALNAGLSRPQTASAR